MVRNKTSNKLNIILGTSRTLSNVFARPFEAIGCQLILLPNFTAKINSQTFWQGVAREKKYHQSTYKTEHDNIVFIKQTPIFIDDELLSDLTKENVNIIVLIRDPVLQVASLWKIVRDNLFPQLSAEGLKIKLANFPRYLTETTTNVSDHESGLAYWRSNPFNMALQSAVRNNQLIKQLKSENYHRLVVVDVSNYLVNPEQIYKKLCYMNDLEYFDSMLSNWSETRVRHPVKSAASWHDKALNFKSLKLPDKPAPSITELPEEIATKFLPLLTKQYIQAFSDNQHTETFCPNQEKLIKQLNTSINGLKMSEISPLYNYLCACILPDSIGQSIKEDIRLNRQDLIGLTNLIDGYFRQ